MYKQKWYKIKVTRFSYGNLKPYPFLWIYLCICVGAGGGSGICGFLHMEVSQSRSVEPAPWGEHSGQWGAVLRHVSDLWWEARGCGGHRTAILRSADRRWVQTPFSPPGPFFFYFIFFYLKIKCSNNKQGYISACNFYIRTIKKKNPVCICSFNATRNNY